MESVIPQINKCAILIKDKLGLKRKPKIKIVEHKFDLLSDGWYFELCKHPNSTENEWWAADYTEGEVNICCQFRECYYRIFYEADKNEPFHPIIHEITVTLGGTPISAAYNHLISGYLQTGERFLAVLSLEVRALFYGCGLASLLKLAEIEFAKGLDVSFIQTFHDATSPFFVSAIAPGLKNGFVLYHGSETKDDVCQESYEEEGCIHLRKYFLNGFSSKVEMEGSEKPLISPNDNSRILALLNETKRRYKGMAFLRIGKLQQI